VALPRLMLATQDTREIARVIRGALRLRTEVVDLVEPPVGTGQHLLEIEIPGVGNVSLLAEPTGSARPDGGVPLSVRPVTRVLLADLFALVEKLDEPSRTDPPPPDEWSEDDEFPQGPEDTMVDAIASRVVLPIPTTTTSFGSVESLPPSLANTAPPDPKRYPSSGNGMSAVVIPQGDRAPSSFTKAATQQGDRSPSSLSRVAQQQQQHQHQPGSDRSPSSRERLPSGANHKQADPRVGRLLAGKYLIEAPIGSGAAATVYKAMHKDLRRPVAVKILHAENQSETQFIRRFKAEALTASKLEHANVTRIIDFGAEKGELYLVMELVVGRSLEAILAGDGPLPQKRVIDIGIQVCRALVFAHGHGVIHRDIKPENVMLVPDVDDDGEPTDLVKVCDFGLAKMREPADGESMEITMSGMLCGSPAYMSPEQTRGDSLDARTDVYSLGVTMFEALTGVFPHEAFSITELFLKKCTEPARRASSLVPSLDPLLDDIIMRAMAIDPKGRHDSARELRTELRAARDQLSEDEDSPPNTIQGG
jgi:tRNA A-37 threonylcarbamoyl transferase component Bud32